ncbi:uncharacterized protein LOC144435020 isoform X1 [Glandiceps talaboti]
MAQWINKLFVNTSNQITDSNVVRLKFLLTDLIGDRNLERCDKAVDLFFLLKEQGHISERNLELVKELLWLIDENKLIKDKFREDLHDVERKFQTQGKISSYRRLLHHIGNNLKREDIADVIYQFREKLTARVREQKCIWTTFKHLERRLVLSKDPKVLSRDDGLQGVLATIGRNDLARLVEEYSPDRYRAPTYQGLTVPDHQQTPRDYKRTRSDYNQMLQDPKQRQPNYKRTLSDYQQRHQDYQETQRKQTHSNTPQTGTDSSQTPRHVPPPPTTTPELLSPAYFGQSLSHRMRALDLSSSDNRVQTRPFSYGDEPGPQLAMTQRSKAPTQLGFGSVQPRYGESLAISHDNTKPSSAPESTFMFSHLHSPQPRPLGQGDDVTASNTTEQSMQYRDSSMAYPINPYDSMRHQESVLRTGTSALNFPQQTVSHSPATGTSALNFPQQTVSHSPATGTSALNFPQQTVSISPSTAPIQTAAIGGSTEVTSGSSLADGQSIALAVPSISLPATSVPSTTSSPAAVTATSDVAASVPEPSVSPTPVPLTSMEIASPIIETASPVKIHLPQTAVSPSSQVVPSNPTEESTAPAPVLQWTSSHLGHRLETFNYDQISEMACDFKNVICTEGGFGDVFKGKIKLKCGLDYTVAVKRLKLTQLFGSQGEKHFDRERSVAKVRHPYIMPVIGICEQESKPMCIVYPYMSGGDLKQAIDSKDPRLTWQRRLAIVHQVSSALIYLHKETPNKPTILHLDVKPGNILLDDNFNARLGDVGLSKELDIGKSYASVTACHPGTPGYQDPAMFDEWKQRPYNDLFSLGIVMLCLLTCMPAFLETERKPLHIELRNKRCFKDCMKLLEEANKDVWPVEDEVEKIFSINFADLICQCVKKNPFKRIEWEKFNNEIKKITVDAECRIYNEPTGDDLCAMCSVQPRVRGLALKSHYCDSSCDKICLQCLIDSDKNPLVCPSHGDAEPPIGHSDSFAIFIGTKDSDADFHPDAKGLYKVFTHPEIGAIRKENAILMTSKQVSDELKPTSKNILAQLSIMEERMRGAHEASLIFHFSGHGGRQGEILVCGSDDFLQASELKLKLHTMNFTQLLIILDCCYAAKNGPLPSGFFVNSPSSIVTKGDNDLATDCDDEELCSAIPNLCKLTESDDVIEKASPSPTTSANYSIVQWSASKGPETALGYKTGKSVFTTHVQEGLHAARKCRLKNSTENSKCAKCCSYRDEMKRQSYITFNELTDYVYHHVTKEVAEHRKEQHPQTVAEENTRRRIIAYCKAENQ